MNILIQFSEHAEFEVQIDGFTPFVEVIQILLWIGWLVSHLTS